MSEIRYRSVVADFGAGFLAFCLLLASLIIHPGNNLQLLLLVTSGLFFAAGMMRGASAPQRLWLKCLLIELGGAFGPVVLRLTGNGFNGAGTLELFLVFSLMLGLSGIQTRRFIAAGRTRAAALVGSLTLGGAIVIVAGSIPALLAKLSNQHVNRPAPVFGFVSLDGKPVTSAELHGRVVVLAFWATWCQPCRQELPQLQELRARLKGTGAVEFWGIGGPWGEDTVAKESEYAKKLNLDLPLGFASDEAKKALGVELFPTLIILDKAGRVRVVHTGFDESEHLVPNLEGEVRALTREPSQGS